MLQCPPARRQSEFCAQLAWVTLHLPTDAQSPLDMQLDPVKVQLPGRVGQLALDVQLVLVWMLHVPGLGVHTGGWQVVEPVHGFSGSGGSRLQPGGL